MEDSNQNEMTKYEIHKHSSGVRFPAIYWNYVMSKWMRSYRFNNDYIKLIDSDSYYLAYSTYLARILLRPNVFVRVAVLADDADVLLGFSVIEEDALHYVFVHKDFRKIGIATKLVPININWFTHLTKTGLKLWSTKLKNAKFDPFK